MPKAFKECLSDPKWDVACLIEHDEGKVLGKRSTGTLRIEEDDVGLKFSCDVPNTTYGQDLVISAERGDVVNMSFGFDAGDLKQEWSMEEGTGVRIRQLHKLKIYEISTTGFPAYEDAELALRSYKALPVTPPVVPVLRDTEELLMRQGVKIRSIQFGLPVN